MPPIPFADNFLAGSIISLLFPILLLIAIAVWYVFGVKRFGDPPAAEQAKPDAAPGPGAQPPGSPS
jgi:hypothetical protein